MLFRIAIVPVILNCLHQEEPRFAQTLKDEQGKCRISRGLSEGLSDKFKLQHKEKILSLQYCKLTREQNEKAEELSQMSVGTRKRQKTKRTIHKWYN